MRITNDGCTAFSEEVEIVYLGLANELSDRAKIYPNPVTDHLIVECAKCLSSDKIIIRNLLGNTLINVSYSEYLDISLPTGIYSIELHTSDGIFVGRLGVE